VTRKILYLNYYKTQRNLVVKLNKQAEQDYFGSCKQGSSEFWQKSKCFFSNKSSASEKINLVGPNNEYITDD